jgi:hypothetical protein
VTRRMERSRHASHLTSRSYRGGIPDLGGGDEVVGAGAGTGVGGGGAGVAVGAAASGASTTPLHIRSRWPGPRPLPAIPPRGAGRGMWGGCLTEASGGGGS